MFSREEKDTRRNILIYVGMLPPSTNLLKMKLDHLIFAKSPTKFWNNRGGDWQLCEGVHPKTYIEYYSL